MNLRQLKNKIKSINNVGQITKAMQLVSAVKMKKAQEKATLSKPYRNSLQDAIGNLVSGPSMLEESALLSKFSASKKLAIVVSSNKGLCGVFNFNLFRFLVNEIPSFAEYDFIIMGYKAQQFLFHSGATIVADFSAKIPFENNVTAVFSLIKELFMKKTYSTVELFYNQFINSLVYKPTKEILLPLSMDAFPEKKQITKDYKVEPDLKLVINGLFNFFIENEIRNAIRESDAAEQSARMIAMKNATDNSMDLAYRLTLLRNGIRQEKITNELLDMNTSKLAVS